MSIDSGIEDPREEAYRQMEAQKNMNKSKEGGSGLPPVLNPEFAKGGSLSLEDKLSKGEMTPHEAEEFTRQLLDASPDLLAKIDEIDRLSMPTPEQINLGLGSEKDQERAAQARQTLIDQATTRAVTFFVKEAGRGAYKDVSPEDFVKGVREGLHATMERALVPIMAEAKKSAERRARGEKASTRQAA